MTSKFGAFITEIDDSVLEFFIQDARFTAARTVSHINMSDAATLSTFDHLVERASEESSSALSVIVEEDTTVTTPLIALFLSNILYRWEDELIPNYDQFIRTLWFIWQPQEDDDSRLLDRLLSAMANLIGLAKPPPVAPDLLIEASKSFQQLALELNRTERIETALACAITASNFACLADPSYAAEQINQALLLAQRNAAKDIISSLLFRRAHLLAQLARQNPARRVDAFDAIEVALRHFPENEDNRQEMVKVLQSWIEQEEYLHILAPMLWLVQPPEQQAKHAVDIDGIAAAVNPIWSGEFSGWVNHLNYIQALSIEIANARLALLPKPVEKAARALWSTWSLRHSHLLNAIPHGTSILREEFLPDILLELSHEIIHVYSMFGFIGVTLTAMRWALLEAELDIWARKYYVAGEAPPPDFYEGMTPAPLQEADMIALIFAERAVEIERKIQILENTWAPWFEGLAIFGELAADPQMDPEWESPVGVVVYNLWDRSLKSVAGELNISLGEAAAQDRVKADAMYAEAIHSQSHNRLRTYLTRNHRKYLAGYLAVRSVVAAWRSTLRQPIRGDQAFRVLLHMTRFGGFEAIPDLGQPLKEFQEAVRARQLEWISAIAGASASDLKEILDNDKPNLNGKPFRWVLGKLQQSALDEAADEQMLQTIESLTAQCLSTLTGERASLDRVEGASEAIKLLLEATAERLEARKKEPRLSGGEMVARFSFRYTILPLGQVACPFWLLQKDRRLACLIRSKEQDRDRGKPSYDLAIFPLKEEEYLSLEAKVIQGRARHMIVTRVVDLLDGPEGRMGGANLIVFQYEDWMIIQPRGVLFGLTEVSQSMHNAIKDRLAPISFLAYQEKLTGEDHPCARRTAEWVEANTWHLTMDEGLAVDISPWAQHVRAVASQVISNNIADVESISLSLLNFVFGSHEIAQKLFEQGFEQLYDEDHLKVRELIKFIDDSARMPVDNRPELDDLKQVAESFMAPLIEPHEWGWDVVQPKSG
jgi:hypothetical protein